MSKELVWHKIAESIEELMLTSTNNLSEVQVGNKNICIAFHDNTLFACAAKCPHAGGKFADGFIDAVGNIVCPLHKYKFNLENGRNISGEGYYLKRYPTQINENGIFVGIEKKQSWW